MNSFFLLENTIFRVMVSSFYLVEEATNYILSIKYFKGDNHDS